MKIDPKIEEPLRKAFAAVVDQDADNMVPPLQGLTDEQGMIAGSYAVFVIDYAMHDVYDDPDADAAGSMAHEVVTDVSKWIDVGTKQQVSAFLLACSRGDAEFTGVDRERIPAYSLITAGYLLSRFRPEGLRWFEYLDQIWNFAEQQPAP